MLIHKITNHYRTYGLAHTFSSLISYGDKRIINPLFLIRAGHDALSKANIWQKPSYLQIEPTNRCNLICASCNRRDRKNLGDMSFAEFNRIIDQFEYLRIVKLQGMGEPLLNPDFFLMLGELKKRGITTYCATNGTLLNEKSASLLIQLCDIIEISLDSPVKEEAEELRSGLDFDKLLASIKLLVSKNRHKEIRLNYVLIDRNLRQLNRMVDILHSLGVSYLNVVELQNWGHERGELLSSKGGLKHEREILNKCREYGKKKGVHICFSERLHRYSRCPWYKKRCFISWDGYVTPCCLRPNPDRLNMGNILKTDIKTIWNGKKYIELRRSISLGIPGHFCKGCSLIEGEYR